MGNYANKLLFRIHENQKDNNESDSNVQTPKLPQKRILVDPRSITVGITRTPIEVNTPPLTTTKRVPSAIPRHLQTKQFLETNLDVIMPPLSPKKPPLPRSIASNLSVGSDEKHDNDYLTPKTNVAKGKKKLTIIDKERYRVLGLDPRSPAADFERTPILVSKSLALIRARSQEHLNRKGSYETDVYNPDSPGNLEISLSRSIPELFSNVASEIRTKLDLKQATETGTIKSESSDDEVFESEEEQVTVINNPKFKKRQETSSISSEQTVTIDKEENTKSDNYENTESNTMKTTHSNNSDNKIEVWHDSLSSEKELSGKKEVENIIEKLPRGKVSREEIIITFDECTTISTSSKTIKSEDCHKAGNREDGKRKSIKPDIKFTSNEKKIFTPEQKYGTEMSMNRTPLGNRSNNGQKMALNLIQRSKNTVDTRIQQENTPPKKYNIKSKSDNQWDPNTTVFI